MKWVGFFFLFSFPDKGPPGAKPPGVLVTLGLFAVDGSDYTSGVSGVSGVVGSVGTSGVLELLALMV